jgi:hypothetical protein
MAQKGIVNADELHERLQTILDSGDEDMIRLIVAPLEFLSSRAGSANAAKSLGKKRMEGLTKEQQSELGKNAARKRWGRG